ncbi:glycoside hydrolase domain-containing protein [Cytobacillus sp. Hz8]|uniref:glycoside hydrolase domain-containing protein n=1 Tax=Cytobacillus sp. Hz8 TaxID=3347168 RepID=UPI0035D5ECD8
MAYYWGVDSDAKVTKDLYDCVVKKLGKPSFWGRHLATVQETTEGLQLDEIQLLHRNGTKILPIYSAFRKATDYESGQVVAQNAVYHARRLSIPKGKVVFAGIDKFIQVNDDWIRGFVDSINLSGYKPGIYHDPLNGAFSKAYCEAVAKENKIANQVILWSAEPELGTTKARNAPDFRPRKVPCKGNVWGWQYGRDSTQCPIDTNLVNSRFFEALW